MPKKEAKITLIFYIAKWWEIGRKSAEIKAKASKSIWLSTHFHPPGNRVKELTKKE